MTILENNSIQNLHSLYQHIGNNKSVVNSNIVDNYSFIQSYNSAWPNAIYNVKNNCIEDEKQLQEISSKILAKELPALALIYNSKTNTNVLKSQGFYTIEQWILMEVNLDTEVDNNNNNCHVVSSKVELQSWLCLVEQVLFGNKTLDIRIFEYLMQANTHFFYVKQNDQIVGTTLAYIDENNLAGIYMVCINEQFRGKSLAKQLMKFTLNYLQEKSIKKVVLQSTKAGLGLYTSLLFKETGIINLIFKIK